jgi:hypothetical protein
MELRHLPALGALVIAMAGCEASVSIGDDSASGDEIAENVRAEYEKRTGVALEKITCDEAEGEKGAPIRCEAVNAKDVELDIGGEVTEVEDGKVRFRWTVEEALAPGATFADAARRRLEEQAGQRAKGMTCPDRIRLREGEQVRCELETLDDKRFGVTLTLTDASGGFDAKVDDAPTT